MIIVMGLDLAETQGVDITAFIEYDLFLNLSIDCNVYEFCRKSRS
jgi:hypothetical protein